MSTDPAPYLYIISQEVPHSRAAGSILLQRLLKKWPSDRLMVYGPTVPVGAEKLNCEYRTINPGPARLQRTRFAPLAPPLAKVCRPHIKIAGPAPPGAVVLSVMQSSAYYATAYAFARRNRLPLALIVHDDPEEIEPVRWWTSQVVRGINRRIYRAAEARFCISPQMRDVLQRRYGAGADVLYPNRSRNIIARPIEWNAELRRSDRLVLGYAGTLAYGYSKGLERMLELLRDNDVTLRVYSLQKPEFVNHPSVEYAGAANHPDELWPRVQFECDAVVLPYASPTDGHEALYRTHFPSKLPEYLALGMPVIISGPSYATGVQWGLAHQDACITIETGSVEGLAVALRRLAAEGDWRRGLALGAIQSAGGDFAPGRIEASFERRLREITNHPASKQSGAP